MVISGVPCDYIYSMTPMELFFTLNYLDNQARDREEKHRSLCYVIIQSQSTKELSPESLYSLPWDKTTEYVASYDKDEFAHIKVRAIKIENEINHGRE